MSNVPFALWFNCGFVKPGPSRENINTGLGDNTCVFIHETWNSSAITGNKVNKALEFVSGSDLYFEDDWFELNIHLLKTIFDRKRRRRMIPWRKSRRGNRHWSRGSRGRSRRESPKSAITTTCDFLEIADTYIFLLIDMTLQNENLKSYECDEDVKDHE